MLTAALAYMMYMEYLLQLRLEAVEKRNSSMLGLVETLSKRIVRIADDQKKIGECVKRIENDRGTADASSGENSDGDDGDGDDDDADTKSAVPSKASK